VIRARAPLRVSLAGGGTDVPPYPMLRGGAVLSSTVDLFAYASVEPRADGILELRSPDLATSAALSGRERIASMVLRESDHAGGADVVLHCDVPPGSGLGSSSSLIVAMCAALCDAAGEAPTPYELAERAWRIERLQLGILGGMQDQYAAAFGGFNFIEFGADSVLVNPLRVRPDVLAELHGSLLLLPTPNVARRSTGILERQVAAYERKERVVLAALDQLKQQALDMKVSVLRGDLEAMADLLHEGWHTKRLLASGIATPEIDALYEEARRLGALGGKLLGAGGGGFLLLMVPFEGRGSLVRSLRDRGLQPVNFSFTEQGVQVWRNRS
jgi:D-glycero-alpha-D-manno-heptose-7-phosphate kinase